MREELVLRDDAVVNVEGAVGGGVRFAEGGDEGGDEGADAGGAEGDVAAVVEGCVAGAEVEDEGDGAEAPVEEGAGDEEGVCEVWMVG